MATWLIFKFQAQIQKKEKCCFKVPVFYLDISFLDKWTWTIGGRFGNDDRLQVEMSHQNRKDNSLKCLRVFRDRSTTTIHQCRKRREQVKRRRTNCLPPFRRLQYWPSNRANKTFKSLKQNVVDDIAKRLTWKVTRAPFNSKLYFGKQLEKTLKLCFSSYYLKLLQH